MNGHQKLIGLIANCRQEALLWRVTKLMDKIVQMVLKRKRKPKHLDGDFKDAERMVGAGLLEALQRHLDHPSQRLLRQVLSCVRSVSHVPTADRTVQPLLQKLLQLLGQFRTKRTNENHKFERAFCLLKERVTFA